ncbi:MAG TPA: adenylate/guanylate cyclase domain-containing protein [Acidimicrobiales bacterium]|nr:adenylate/guanylate cyclase domain-containing protein [Acidimicrobiales bacterium]
MSTWGCAACGGENPGGTRFCGHCGTPSAAAAPPADAEVADALRALADARATEERRLVTALFADISGFTSLSEQLDAEELHGVISPVISRLAAVAERYDGFIAKYAGDALLVFFGAPVAHEDDAARALLVALEMHEAIADKAGLPDAAAGLELHIGVNTGRVISGRYGGEARADYSILGDAVNLAQRLESVAPSGETYVGESTYRLTADEFEFESVGMLTLKGKAQPVAGYRLLGPRHSAAPSSAAGRPLIGRERELAAVAAALQQHGAVVVSGEPGIGKTRLLGAVQSAADGVWLQTRCLSYGAALPYWPFADLLRRLSGIRPEDDPAGAFDRLPAVPGRNFLARLAGLPVDDADLAALAPDAFRRGLHEAVVAWLSALAPVTLAVEDVHWADTSSLELLAALAGGPVKLVLTTRPEGIEACTSLGAAPVALGPLDEGGVRALVEATLGGVPPLDLVRAVLGRTNGNPLFVEEITRSLVEQGAVVPADGRFTMRSNWDAAALPDTVERVLASRIDGLPASAANVLQTASVIGRVTRRSLLTAVLGDVGDVDDLDAELHRLLAGGFLDRTEMAGEEALAFHHALVQDVAYTRMLARHRRELHLRVAHVAEGLYGAGDDVIDLLARELYLGGAGAEAIDYLVRAGRRAAGLFANDEAIVHLERAAEVAHEHSPERAAELLLDVGELHELVGHFEEARRRYREAGSDLRAWRGMASTLRKQGAYRETLAVLDDAFAVAPPDAPESAALWLEKGWTLCLNGQLDEGLEALHAGLAAAGDASDPVVGDLLVEVARVHLMAGRNHEALEHAQRAQAVFEQHSELRGLTAALRVVGDVHGYLGAHDAAVETLRRGLELARRVGRPDEIGGCLINLGMVELERGELAAAVACDREAVEQFETIGHESGRATAYANLAEKLLLSGDVDEAEQTCQKALSLARGISLTYTVADATQTLGSIRLQQGRADAAVRLFEEATETFGSMGIDARRDQAARLAAEAAALPST